MGEVDAAFILAAEDRPHLQFIEAGGIPLIDLSPVNSPEVFLNPGSIAGVVAEVGDACEKWGFFQVMNHGVPKETREKFESAARKFFALPFEEKIKIRRDEETIFGYHDREHTKNVRDWKEVYDLTVENPTLIPDSHNHDEVRELTNQWTDNPPELREAFEEYVEEMEKLASKLLGLICLSLGLPPDRLNGYFKDQTSSITLNHFTPCPVPHLALGVGPHKDSGVLTILTQDNVGGLEVKRRANGEWVFVKPTPNAYIINLGDILQVWSNAKYVSAEHRVKVNTEKGRYSIPFFLNPSHYVNVKPLKELINKENPPKYQEYNWGKFMATRKLSNFKKLNVNNIQIHHFAI